MQQQDHAVRLITGLSELAPDYDGILSDIWGVVHNGVAAHRAAVEALQRYRALGGRVVLITNAPRPARQVREMLDRLKVDRDAYDDIVTSGDVTRRLLGEHLGRRVFHLGPERDKPIFEGLDFAFGNADDSDFVLCSGPFDDETEGPEDYRDMLEALRARDVEMICANPDIVVERGDRLLYCAGALCELYEAMGGRVIYAGKPHGPIYDTALAALDEAAGGQVTRRRVMAIGDSVRTDLMGAHGMGLDALFIIAGIHAGESDGPDALARLFADAGARPKAVLPALKW